MSRQNGNTKQRLGQALKELSHERPLKKITISDITDRCGVNRQTFYHHFDNLRDLVTWMYIQDLDVIVRESLHDNNMRQALTLVLARLNEDVDYYRALFESQDYHYFRAAFLNNLGELLGYTLKDHFEVLNVEPSYRRFLVQLYSVVFIEFLEKWSRGCSISTIDSFIDQFSRFINEQSIGNYVLSKGESGISSLSAKELFDKRILLSPLD